MNLRKSQSAATQQTEPGEKAARRDGEVPRGLRRPRVSIGLPVYNGDRFLRQALDSMLAQTFTDFELIISDNASTDRTRELCCEYAARDPRIRYHRSETNRGAVWNFNYVFGLASGEYFKWIAHDDLYAPDYLAKCVAGLDRDPSAVLCYPRAIDIDENGNFLRSNNVPLDVESPKPQRRFRHLACINHPCLAVFGVMRVGTLRQTRLYGNYVASDRVFLAELGLRGRFCELPEELFYHREHPNRSTRALPNLQERIAWFDPSQAGRLVFPNWKLFREYFSAVARAPLGWWQRILCYLQMARWVRWNWRELLDDLTYAARQVAGRRGANQTTA